MKLETWRFSRHRGLYAWFFLAFALIVLFAIAAARHAGYNGPAYPNRANSESESSGGAAQGAGTGDVGPTSEHPQ